MESDDNLTIVEKVFPDPDQVSEGEYWALYEFFTTSDIENDPEMILGCLEEFSGWAIYLRDLMKKAGYGDQSAG